MVFGSHAKSIEDAATSQILPSACPSQKSSKSSLALHCPGNEFISLALEAPHEPTPLTSPRFSLATSVPMPHIPFSYNHMKIIQKILSTYCVPGSRAPAFLRLTFWTGGRKL